MRAMLIAVVLLASCGRSRDACSAIADEGWKLYEAGDLGRARETLQAGLKRYPEGPCSWRIRVTLADTLVLRREVDQALQVAGTDLPPDTVPMETRFRYFMTRGYAMGLNGRIEPALKFLDHARTIATAEKKDSWQAEVLLRRANLLIRTDPKNSEAQLRQAVDLASRSGAQRLAVDASLALSFFLIRQERLSEAADILDPSLAVARANSLQASEARILANLGLIHMYWGDHLRALDVLVSAERIARERGMVQEQVATLQNLGNVQYLLRNTKAAASYLDQALEVARKMKSVGAEATILFNRSRVALDVADYPLAEKLIAECYKLRQTIKDPNAELSNEMRTAQLLRGRGKLDEAAQKLSALAKRKLTPSVRWSIESELAAIAQEAGKHAEADKHYREAIAIMTSERKALQSAAAQLSFTSGNVGLHHQYVRYLVERGDPLRALQVAEWSRTTSKLANMPDFTAAGLKDLARRRKSTLLVYWTAPKQSLLWVISPQRFEVVPIAAEEEIRELVERRASGKDLFDKLAAPALPGAARSGSFIVIPDGPLHQVNAEIFHTGSGYWIQSASLVRANSITSLLDTSRAPAANGFLAIGDPDPNGREFPKLPNAAAELSDIESLFKEARVLRQSDATVPGFANVKPGSYRYVHFATHGVSNLKAPLESALILSPSPAGFRLRAADIATQSFNADLVTLASCRSAGSRVSSGGLLGVAWAFLQGGARAVIANLQDVDDRASRQLSRDLYSGVKNGFVPERALREAKLKMLSGGEFSSPDHWGSWVLILGR